MAGAKDKRLRGRLARGTLLSLLLHANLFAPFLVMVWRWAAQEEKEKVESVDVSFDSAPDQELPPMPPEADSPPVTPEEVPPPSPDKLVPPPKEKAPKLAEKKPPKPEPKKKEEDKKKVAEKKPEPEKKVAEKTPEKEVVVPPLPPMPPPPPPPPPQPKSHEKVVDLDNDKEVEPPPDAKFLAQKNNRAEVETRATETNLEREQRKAPEGASASRVDPKAQDQKDVGDEKAKIAQLEEQKGAFGHQVPKAPSPRDREEQSPEDEEEMKRSVLAIREATPRTHTVSPETADPSLPHDPTGMRAAPRSGQDAHDHHDHARLPKGERLKLALSGRDYEYLFGAQADTERREAQKARSTRAGKQAARLARIRSSLENFIPEVKPGNQTALNTRAAPFAAFIAAMHRSIHSLWGFGILEDWDELGGSSPLNNENLMSNLEVVLNGDGSVDKVTVVQGSRYLPFDVAAIDVAYSAGPYPTPPREIRSGNGKIYIHWRFYRDGRQCATSGVDYFILDNRSKDADRPHDAEAAGASPSASGMLHRLSRGGLPAGEGQESSPAESAGQAEGEGSEGASSTAAGNRDGADEEAAKRQASAWWAAFARGDVGAVAARSVVPFRAGETITAKSNDELVPMLRNLLEESSTRAAKGFDVLTGAGLRKILGRLPPAFDDGSGRLFVLVRTSGDAFILRMAPVTSGDWRVDGLLRR